MSLIGALKAAKKTAPFYSAVDEALGNLKRPKGTGIEFLTEVLKQPGVKKAEIADRKLEQAFKAKGKMTKEEAQQVLKENPPPKLQEKTFTEPMSDYDRDEALRDNMERFGYESWEDVPPRIMRKWEEELDENVEKYGDYKTAGGKNYREILLKLPEGFSEAESNRLMALEADMRRSELPAYKMEELLALQAKKQNAAPSYQSGHWKEDPNVLAHMRVQDRTGANGEKILHVEEIQSDWHQAGRKKGYGPQLEEQYRAYYTTPDGQQVDIGFGKTPEELERMTQASGWNTMPVKIETEKTVRQIGQGVPDAPFKKNWHELAMKRLLNYAADNGYDSIAITPGAEQAKRYDLSKQISRVVYSPDTEMLNAFDHNNQSVVMRSGVKPDQVADYIGKEPAQRLFDQQNTKLDYKGGKDVPYQEISGIDLQVGGEGMKGFYDQILPSYLNTFGKPYGAQVGEFKMPSPPKDSSSVAGYPLGEEYMQGRATWSEFLKANPKAADEFFMPLHSFPITPEMRESIKQKGLPLYQQIGIPTAGAGAASQMPEQMQEPELEPEIKKADGGAINYNTAPDMSDGGRIIQGAPFKHGGKVNMTTNRDAMFMELSNKKLKRK